MLLQRSNQIRFHINIIIPRGIKQEDQTYVRLNIKFKLVGTENETRLKMRHQKEVEKP